MKISFFGSSLVSSYWNGAATYYRGMLKALSGLGHDITFYEPDAFGRQQHRDIADPDWARVVVYPATEEGWQRSLSQAASDVDLLVKASGVGVFDEELDTAILDAAPARTIVAYWDVDAPATLERMTRNPDDHLRRAVPRYHLVLTYGGGDPVIEAYERFGAARCVPIYNALDPETHHRVAATPDFHCDLSFLGNRLPDREARVEQFFLKPARLAPELSFLLGGSGWDGKVKPYNVRSLGHVGSSEHNAFFCSALATLNINRDSMARIGFSPPTRIFEAAGAGACVISDSWDGIELFLEPDREILIATDGEGVVGHLSTLAHKRARSIGEAARRRLLAEQTYSHRARQFSKLFGAGKTVEAAA